MRIIDGFDEKTYLEIARASGNRQIVADVKYMRVTLYHKARKVKAERLDDVAFYIGYHNSDHLRLVGIGVRKNSQGKGYGKFMLYRAIQYARSEGYRKMKTRTQNGVDFYQRFAGAKIVGMAGNDFLMEMDI